MAEIGRYAVIAKFFDGDQRSPWIFSGSGDELCGSGKRRLCFGEAAEAELGGMVGKLDEEEAGLGELRLDVVAEGGAGSVSPAHAVDAGEGIFGEAGFYHAGMPFAGVYPGSSEVDEEVSGGNGVADKCESVVASHAEEVFVEGAVEDRPVAFEGVAGCREPLR